MTRSVFIDQQTISKKMWEMAMQWVLANRKLVRQIASPYFRHMMAESEDLLQEATIAAFKALLAARKKEKPKQFVSFFRVIFKTNCIKLASGIQTEHYLEVHNLPGNDHREEQEDFEDSEEIEEALKTVSKRQREICIWLLAQPEPASTPDLAEEFNISRRHACRLISNSINRIAGV
jgi:RNA polymerase sigma factor (sigma-70 family)